MAVTYTTIEEAHLACSELNGYIEDGRELVVSGSYLKTEATSLEDVSHSSLPLCFFHLRADTWYVLSTWP